ncbi:cupin domain-containing protein [Cohnella sp. REN36]|uniref:cupin domain-containing protein n=1 Tax=Cohnella sp. REN36 TaxID=2887347 RepID=UPI001D139561|nr:cupin domain-containing protein [Cohnella sp. REN36]MCC3375403.1 cupin domain-containing protein [Cohnella sp. REN36]
MAQAGDLLADPLRGQKLVIRKTAKMTRGEVLEMEASYAPGSGAPPEHLHPEQEERFEVLTGCVHARVNGKERIYRTGERFRIPPGMRHTMWNGGNEPARLLWETLPALDTERFFETTFALSRAGKTNAAGAPNLLQSALLMQRYKREFRLANPPRFVQTAIFGLLAPIARLLGYRA